MNPTIIFLLLYVLIGAVLGTGSVMVGNFMAPGYGQQVSTMVFLTLFMASVIVAFPIAFMLTPKMGEEIK